MKKHLLISLISLMPALALQAQTESATDAVKNMGLGWNLGNTLDANNGTGAKPEDASYWGVQGLESENCWGQPTTSKELIKMMKNAGYGAIRVPVTWYNHMDKDGKVDAAWMKRVHEVVDYVINEDLYCIVNVHHDTGADGDTFHSWIKADEDNYAANKDRFEGLWTQIAEEFKDYGEKLLFEGYNEMLDAQNTWNAPKNESSYNAINNYAQSFVNAVRATGSKNADRNLIVNTYAAANQEAPEKKLAIPEDGVDNHIIVEVHAYPNFFTWTNPTLRTIAQVKSDVDYIIKQLNDNYITKGIPAIIGEWSSYPAGKEDYAERKDMFFEFCDYFVRQATAKNIAMFYWMGLSDEFFRGVPAFDQADLAELLAKAYHGDDFKGEYPVMGGGAEVVCFEGEKTMQWGQKIGIKGDLFKDFGPTVQLNITYTQQDLPTSEDDTYRGLQFWYDDWSEQINITVDGIVYEHDFQPFDHYGTPQGTEHTTGFTFDEDTYNTILKKGLLFQGYGIIVTKVTLTDYTPSSIDGISNDQPASEVIYDLSGRQVVNPGTGIFIQGGKKMIRNK